MPGRLQAKPSSSKLVTQAILGRRGWDQEQGTPDQQAQSKPPHPDGPTRKGRGPKGLPVARSWED